MVWDDRIAQSAVPVTLGLWAQIPPGAFGNRIDFRHPYTHHSCYVLTTTEPFFLLFMNATSLNVINNLSRIWPFPCCNVVTKCKWAQIQNPLTYDFFWQYSKTLVRFTVWAHCKTRTWLVTSDNTLRPESHLNFTHLQTWCFHYFGHFLEYQRFLCEVLLLMWQLW